MLAGYCAGSESHKTAGRGRLLTLYYWRPVLTVVCSLNEMFFLMLYVKAFVRGPMLLPGVPAADALLYVSAPVCALKQLISVTQVVSAHYTISDALSDISTSTSEQKKQRWAAGSIEAVAAWPTDM
eukprot:IDg20060t1